MVNVEETTSRSRCFAASNECNIAVEAFAGRNGPDRLSDIGAMGRMLTHTRIQCGDVRLQQHQSLGELIEIIATALKEGI